MLNNLFNRGLILLSHKQSEGWRDAVLFRKWTVIYKTISTRLNGSIETDTGRDKDNRYTPKALKEDNKDICFLMGFWFDA